MRTLLALIVVLNVPVALFFIGYGLLQLNHQAGIGVFLFACGSVSIAALTIAAQMQPHHQQ
jgi:hypothetical protein